MYGHAFPPARGWLLPLLPPCVAPPRFLTPLSSSLASFSAPLQYLVRRGVSEDDAARLLAYRDKALKATASAAPAAAQPPPEPAALGVQDTGTKMPFQAPAGASSSSAAATVTLTRTLVTTKQEAEGAPVLAVAAPAVETRSRKEALTVRAI